MPGSRTRAASDAACRGHRLGRAVSRQDSPRLDTAIAQASGAGRIQSGHAHASPRHPAVAHASRSPAGTQHHSPPGPADSPTCAACCRSSMLRSQRNESASCASVRTHATTPSSAARPTDPDARCRRYDPARQPGGGATVRLFAERAHRQSTVVFSVDARSGSRPSRPSATAKRYLAPSSSRRDARTARPAISKRRHRDGRAKAGHSSPRSCVTSTSGAWPSVHFAS